MGKNKGYQLDLSRRKIIQNSLAEGKSLKEIADILKYHPSTISREIFKYRILTFKANAKLSLCITCKNYKTCHLKHKCGDFVCQGKCCGCLKLTGCTKYQSINCKIKDRFPFVCVNCARKSYCMLNQYAYDANKANVRAIEVRSESRQGLNMTEEEYFKMNEILKNGHEKGQTVYHIVHANTETINRTVKSMYNYINNNQVSVKRIDLPRAVILKKRKHISSKYEYNENKNIDRSNRTYADWLVYQADKRLIVFWQMDFLGAPKKSEQQILMFTLRQFQFSFFVPIKHPDSKSVKNVFDKLESMLGEDFSKVFEAILTDRDCKFNCFKEIEINDDGVVRTHVFFCDPARSNEKPNVENFNQQCRKTFKKGVCLNNITWEQCNIISSNYNSRYLNSIDGKRPIDLFIKHFGIEVLNKLGLKVIDPKEVTILDFKKY